jgi:ATP-dependent DNA helicase RecQ
MTTIDGISRDQVSRILKDVFGFSSFRANQEEIVCAIMDRHDGFVVMPTGGGKSLCYQLPAHLMKGTCIVISPLISLMKDQVDAAIANGLRASFLNSSLSVGMKRDVQAELIAGNLDLLYVSPERFAMPDFLISLRKVDLSFVAIDEAHCISEWGHDFRPDYLNLSQIVTIFPKVPIAAFTATATHRVQEDIVTKLGLRNPHMVRASFNRPNLFYKVVPKDNPSAQILRFVKEHAGEPGIIYRTTRKNVEKTAAALAKKGIKALPYHAGLPDKTRVKNQDAFNRDSVDVIVATIAFGMGIDKSNVRYVLHADLPKNMEGYYQETGRSGRDGEPAHCLLLFGYGDIPKIRFFIDEISDDTERNHAIKCLNDMVHYSTVHSCRRKQILNYFGESYSRDTEALSADAAAAESAVCCDICAGEVESVKATTDAQIVMSAIARTGQRFGIGHIVSVVLGESTDRIVKMGHEKIKTFGVGQNRDRRHWRLIIDNLLAQGLIAQTPGDYPVLQLEPDAKRVLFEGVDVHVLKTRKTFPKPRKRHAAMAAGEYDENLFEHLRALRKSLASEQGVPPFVVFSDKTLHEMARFLPATKIDLLNISGVGEAKLDKYGEQFLYAIQEFNAMLPAPDPTP